MSEFFINPKEARKLGRNLAWGFVDVIAVIIVFSAIVNLVFDHDDCDKSWWKKCGLKVVTDAKTGIEYLLSPDGGIIERNKKP